MTETTFKSGPPDPKVVKLTIVLYSSLYFSLFNPTPPHPQLNLKFFFF